MNSKKKNIKILILNFSFKFKKRLNQLSNERAKKLFAKHLNETNTKHLDLDHLNILESDQFDAVLVNIFILFISIN